MATPNGYANPTRSLLALTKAKAKKRGLDFNLDLGDLVIPEFCPVLGIKLIRGDGEAAPSIDKIDNAKGYVKGNIAIISKRANRLKSDASLREVEALLAYMKNGQ